MKRTLTIILLLVFAIFTIGAASAAVDSVDILIKALVNKGIITEDDAASVRAEIATIRQDEEAARKSYNVSGKKPIKLSGYVQERYVQSDAPAFNDSLEARRVRLSLAGDATPDLDFKVQVDFAGSRKGMTDSSLNNGSLTTKSGNFAKPLLLDAVLGYRLPQGNKLSIGQFKIPFGQENLTSSPYLDTINRSQVTEALVPGRDIGSQGRDIGIQFSGTKQFDEAGSRQIEYALGVFDGAGINVGDDNGAKDLVGRIVWKPGIDGLSLGLAHYNGTLGAIHADHIRSDIEAAYLYGKWALKSEYIWGEDGDTNKNGWYATLTKFIGADWQAVARYDLLDPDTSLGNNAVNTLTLGLNKFLDKDGYSRWQVNYERRREQGDQIPNNQFLAQFQAGF